MTEIILENTVTGETKIMKGPVTFTAPWKVKEIKKTRTVPALLAVWAQKRGLPVADFMDGARWLLQKDCPFCQEGTKVLRAIEDLGTERAEEALTAIFAAKTEGDLERLAEIRKNLWPSDQQTSLPAQP